MSRTTTYNMMENRRIDLSLGCNAIDFLVYDNGLGSLDNLTNKFNKGKSAPANISLAGFDSPTYLDNASLEDTYSLDILDDILDGKSFSPGCRQSTDILDTPLASPLLSSDESSTGIDELLSACPDEVLASKVESSSVPLVEHMYASSAPIYDIFEVQSKAEFSPMSDDSGFLSGEDSVENQDLLACLLNGGFDISFEEDEEPVINQDIPDKLLIQEIESRSNSPSFCTIDVSELNEVNVEAESSLSTNNVSSNSTNRYSPYKKMKNPEQRLKKKSQNRKAASRYRSKKKIEMDVMLNEAEELESKNKELRDKVGGLKNEIDYLKNLMLDVIKARLASGNISLDEASNNAS